MLTNNHLLKGLFILCLFWGVNRSFAQRLIDFEVESITPSGDVINGNALPLTFKFTIHGPDAWQQGDSIIYFLYTMDGGQLERFIWSGILYNYYQDFDSGQVLQYGDNYEIRFDRPGLTEPKILDFCVSFYSRVELEGGDSLILSWDDPDRSNNTSCQQVTVYPRSTGMSDPDSLDATDFVFFPNPATDRITISKKGKDEHSVITLHDISGRQLLMQQFKPSDWANGAQQLDISCFPAGIYLLTIQTSSQRSTKKLSIQR